MAIENKVFKNIHKFSENDILYQRASFGWSLVSGTDEKMFFSRETTMPDYRHLKDLENTFDKLLALYIKYDKRFKINKMALLLLAIFTIVIGALIYLIVLMSINIIYKSKATTYYNEMHKTVEAARKIRYSTETSGLLKF